MALPDASSDMTAGRIPCSRDSSSKDFVTGSCRESPAAGSGNEWLMIMADCFAQLDEGHRKVLTLRTRFNLSYEEIAVELETQAGTVRETVRRAREHLRALLIEQCPDFPQPHNTPSSATGQVPAPALPA